MKKIKYLLFILLMAITFNVKAAGFQYYITNSNNYEPINNSEKKNINRGDTITVTAMINNSDDVTTYTINSGKLTIRWDDKFFSLQEVDGKYYNDSISDIEGLKISSVSKLNNKITIGEISSTGTLKPRLNKLVEFKFKVLETASSGDTRIYQMDGEDNLKCLTGDEIENCGESSLSELKYTIAKSTDNKLSSIKIDGKEIASFNENNNTYDINVDQNTSKIKIEAVKKDSRATVTGDVGEKELQFGSNRFMITVTSESGSKLIYVLNVNRVDKRSSVNTLKTLALSNGDLKFNAKTTEYNVNVPNEVDKITVTSSLTDTKSKYEVDYRNKEVELVEGSNKIEIKVIAENGKENVYTININRALSANNSLKSLKVNDIKIELSENNFTYDVTVENDVDEAIIKATPNDSRATVNLDDKYPLLEGENEINIKVAAPSGEEALYIVNVTRKKTLSKDSVLTSLVIKGYDIGFKPSVTMYNLEIKKDDYALEITTTTEDPNATVEIEGNKDLDNGSIVKINVKAEDGTYTRYFINIEKSSSGIPIVVIIIIVLLFLLAGCIGLIIYRKKKKENDDYAKLDNDIEETDSNIEESNINNEDIPIEKNIEPSDPQDGGYVGEHETYVGTHVKEEPQNPIDNEKDV